MTRELRKYAVKDVEMLLTASTITMNAIAHKEFLQSKRSTWSGTFFEDLAIEIDTIIEVNLSFDNARELRQSTIAIYAIQSLALIYLAEVKVQIEEDFKVDPIRCGEILSSLGFKDFYTRANKNGDQEALINLLYQFKDELKPALKAEIIAKGTAEEMLNLVNDQATALKNLNLVQEFKKGERKEVTEETVKVFNAIYDKIISVARISRKFYRANPAKMDMFSFAKIAKGLNRQPSPEATPTV